MIVNRQRRRAALASFLLAAATVAACDASVTAPAPVSPAGIRPAAIEGDTTRCLRGWVVINGWYVCNEDL